MGKQKTGSEAGALLIVVVIAVTLAAIPWNIWTGLAVFGLFVFGIYLYTKLNAPKHAQSDEPTLEEIMAATATPKAPRRSANVAGIAVTKLPTPPQLPTLSTALNRENPAVNLKAYFTSTLSVPHLPIAHPESIQGLPAASHLHTTMSSSATPPAFHIPSPPAGYGEARWIGPGVAMVVAGATLPGGMVYIGTAMHTASSAVEPCLINPRCDVAKVGDFTVGEMGYWPSYSRISATARRAYLNWLAGGRNHPDCDIGFVFLFFYGLEYRIIVDAESNPDDGRDLPAIVDEIGRLISIYGERSPSFRHYAEALLDWMSTSTSSDTLYSKPLPTFSPSYELPFYIRLALGQTAVDRVPIPRSLALAWVQLSPSIALRTAAKRCPEEFGRLFIERYEEFFGQGLVLPKNRTKLKLSYRPASSGLQGASTLTKTFGDIPDVTALTAPLRSLQEIVEQCTNDLSAFSRVVGKDPTARHSLDGLLHLPISLWPTEARALLQSLVDRVTERRVTLTLGEVVRALGGTSAPLSRDKILGLARVLEESRVGVEPNVLAGAKTPTITDSIVLFSMTTDKTHLADNAAYQSAMLTLQLASAVAQADGEFSASEQIYLSNEIQGWHHLTSSCQQRLQAHLQWLISTPATLASLKKKLAPLDLKAKETIASFMAMLAHADGTVSPAEVKILEKVYKALGVESKRVFADVHAASTGASPSISREPSSFRLDTKRIAELQQDTEKVTALLANIFKEEDAVAPSPAMDDIEDATTATGLLGLDEAHATLIRLLLSRAQWTRAELEDAAADLELMLDGALERINEAAFDAYDMPLTEGEDPVDVNAEVLEKVAA